MARLFDDGDSEYLIRTDVLGLTDYPFTFSCWFNSDVTNNQVLMALGSLSSEIWQELRLRDPADSDIIALARSGGSSGFAKTSTQWSVDTWQHALGVFAADADRRVYLNGGGKGTDSTSKDFESGSLNRFSIGVYIATGTPVFYMSDSIAEAAAWDAILTDADALVLAAGYSPLFVRPQNLIAYWPLIRGLNDIVGNYSLTAVSGNSGPIVSAHPRIIRPAG